MTVKYIFGIFDYTSIFLLIAGTYSPILGILCKGEAWARFLLVCLWIAAGLGIATAAFYRGPGQTALQLSFYCTMGWCGILCVHHVAPKIGRIGLCLFIGGGLLVTAGVPWLVRSGHTRGIPDHAIWHIWVVAGTTCHFFLVYVFCLARQEPSLQELPLLQMDYSEKLRMLSSAYSSESDGPGI